MKRGVAAAMFAVVAWLSPHPAQAADLTLIETQIMSRLPVIRPDWPQPDEPGQVFFVQRSMNPNTVVYVAETTADGAWANPPVSTYWRRYNTDGAARALSFLEDRFAYGVRIGPATETATGAQYRVTLRALPDMPLVLAMDAHGPGLFLPRGGDALRLISAYLTLDETGLAPQVTRMVLVGRNAATNAVEQLTYAVTGAAIEETQ